jgi:predicted PhzF superfamily epimerase YddE/YHI9
MPYGGNPAAVLLLPYGLTLSDVTMKAIAAENNLSEVDPLTQLSHHTCFSINPLCILSSSYQ